MSDELVLSIVVLTYNHEDYIEEALDGVLRQNIKYKYELIIGDDASTDGTQNKILKFSENYKGDLQLVLRNKNMGGKGANNLIDLLKRCKGKYVIILEGDDFWTDCKKINQQIEFLEKNSEYIAVAHNCIVVDANSNANGEVYPECHDSEYSFAHLCSNILPGQLTTILHKNIYIDSHYNCSILEKSLLPGDRLIVFILNSYGKIYCIQKVMSAYRHITSGGSSFSSYNKWDYEAAKKWNFELRKYSKEIDNIEAEKCADLLMMKTIIGSRKRGNYSWGHVLNELNNNHFPIQRYCQYLAQLIRRKVFRQKVWG